MGQYVRFQVTRPDDMSEKEWNTVVNDVEEAILRKTTKEEPTEYSDEYEMEFILWKRIGNTCEKMVKEILKNHLGKGFTIKAWYEETEPDETIIL
jgi:hypothetical protein